MSWDNLPIKDVLHMCQINLRFQENARLNEYFGNLTKNNWYQTFLSIKHDVYKTANILIDQCPIKTRRYLNIEELRKDVSYHLRELLITINSINIYIQDIHSEFYYLSLDNINR